MTTFQRLMIPALFLLLAGCGRITPMPEQVTYSSEHTGVSAGGFACNVQWTSTDKNKYCQALNDEVLNKGCAVDSRRATFEQIGCPGEFNAKISVDFTPEITLITPDLKVFNGNATSLSDLSSTEVVDTFSYSYASSKGEENCSTGVKIVHSRVGLCGVLLDNEANQFCAPDERQALYDRNCL